jgi:hypothetical protein
MNWMVSLVMNLFATCFDQWWKYSGATVAKTPINSPAGLPTSPKLTLHFISGDWVREIKHLGMELFRSLYVETGRKHTIHTIPV